MVKNIVKGGSMADRHITVRMIISGFAIMIIGFLYESTFAGIPYLNLIQALIGKYNFQSVVAKYIYELGLTAIFAGLVLLVVSLAQNFLKKSS